MFPVLILFFWNCCIYCMLSAECDSKTYVSKMRDILVASSDYDVFEGYIWFDINATNDFANPTSVYGTFDWNGNKNISEHVISFGLNQDVYYFRAQNAVIIPGCTAPKVKYMSFSPDLYSRYYYNASTQKHDRVILFAELTDPMNQLTWNTSSSSASSSSSPYDSLFTMVQTADKQTWNDLKTLFTSNGISEHELNLQGLPQQYMNFLPYDVPASNRKNYKSTYDTGTTLYRTEIAENNDEYLQYINQNMTVFLVEPKAAKGNTPRIPFAVNLRDPYSPLVINETVVYKDALNEFKDDLVRYIEDEYKYRLEFAEPFINAQSGDTEYGYACINSSKTCDGIDRDCQYWAGGPAFLKNDSFFLILGLVHSNINVTTYSNIGIYTNVRIPFANINDLQYNGSALALPVNTNVDRKYLENMFVVQLSRPHSCIKGLPGWCFSEREVASDSPNLFAERNYLCPITKTRPDRHEMVVDKLLTFTIPT